MAGSAHTVARTKTSLLFGAEKPQTNSNKHVLKRNLPQKNSKELSPGGPISAAKLRVCAGYYARQQSL